MKTKLTTKQKEARAKRRVRQLAYTRANRGMLKPEPKTKMNWVSKENKHGFSLGLKVGERTFLLKNLRLTAKQLDYVFKNPLTIKNIKVVKSK